VLGTIVDTDALWQTVVYALVGAVGITLVFAIAVRGAARADDYSRRGQTLPAVLSGTLAIVGLVAAAAAIAVGVIVMSSK
jgi:ABC-type Fe3+ transport system permease subunit